MEIHFHASSDVGRVRSGNEDYFFNEKIDDDEYVFAVADGMGGHLAGDVASRLACERFLEGYKVCRKKKMTIPESLEFAIRKANQAILKKGEDDPMKKGMGTTFSAVAIEGMKAWLVHIGDSRIYFIRHNQIRRLTTDHTFVEKLVENGRISADEAREHPQKNVLYMSLGAREGFLPEIISDFALEEGDAFILCTDGLSNLVNEEQIKESVLAQLPEDAAADLIARANANGGTDNITLQVVRFGSVESLEKTRPVRISRPRKAWITLLAIAGFLLVLLLFWLLYKQIEGSEADAGQAVPKKAATAESQSFSAVREIPAETIAPSEFAEADFRFLALGKCYIVKGRALSILDLSSLGLATNALKSGQQPIPAADGGVFFFARRETAPAGYALLQAVGGREYPLPAFAPRGELTPLFITSDLFFCRDDARVYVWRDWRRQESSPAKIFPLAEIVLVEGTQLHFRLSEGDCTLTYYQPREHLVKVFSFAGNFSRLLQIENLAVDMPLALEYLPDRSLAFYFHDRCLMLSDGGRRSQSRPYRFSNYQAHIVRILVDIATGQKIMVADNGRLFLMG